MVTPKSSNNSSLGVVGVVVAARTGSTRLPGKALLMLRGKPMILFLLDRIRATAEADEIIFATTTLIEDDEIAHLVEKEGFKVFRGDNEDVVSRYIEVARFYNLNYVVRITGDCPFVDAETLDYCIASVCEQTPFDLASTKGRFPVGIDYEIYNATTMANLHNNYELDVTHREHLTLFMYQNEDQFKLLRINPLQIWESNQKFTVDTQKDFESIQKIANQIKSDDFTISELVRHNLNEN